MLEEMLDEVSKPKQRAGTDQLHYLLFTPFRYPPLQHGSRFGNHLEPSLFYGGTCEYVTLCESAFYRFFFYHDMENPPLHETLQSQHTLFSFRYNTKKGVKLQDPPFDTYEKTLRDRLNYGKTQTLGAAMREAGVKGFEYTSARDSSNGINIAFFDASPLTCTKPLSETACLCQVSATEVIFSIERKLTSFTLEQFLVDGLFPFPAP